MTSKILLWIKLHRVALYIAVAVIALLGLSLGLSLGLTLPIDNVALTGGVSMLTGEGYESGLTLIVTYRSGRVEETPVTADMLEGFDPALRGRQEVSVSYKKHKATTEILVIGNEDLTLCVRDGTLKTEFEPNEAFPTSGIFDLYYNGALYRSSPITLQNAPNFTTRLSAEYDIFLVYREGLSLSYHYIVLEIIDTIEPEGILYAPQGVPLSKSNVVGDLSLHVTYKDGVEERVPFYDGMVYIAETPFEVRDEDYQAELELSYKGFGLTCSVTAYSGELLAPKSVVLSPQKVVYCQGETFDYATTYLEVVFERFGGAPVIIRAMQEMIFLVKWEDDPESENRYFVPITDGKSAILFEEVGEYTLVAFYNSAYSDPIRIRVVSEEDVGRLTGLQTTWRGGRSGPPNKGEELDVTDATLTVEYGYGYRYETVPMSDSSVKVTGYDKDVAGDQTLTVSYALYGEEPDVITNSYEMEMVIRVKDASSDAVTALLGVVGWNDPMYYTLDELVVPETAYLEVEIGYGGRDNEKISLKGNDDVLISGFEPHSLGRQELTLSYAEKEVKFVITVLDDREKTIVDFWAPHDIYIAVGDPLDLSGDCTVFYSTGDQLVLKLSEVLESGGTMTGSYDASAVGDYPVRFYYPGFESSDHFTWIHVQGDAPVVANDILLDVSEAKIAYNIGDKLDIEHMKLYLLYTDGTKEDVSAQLSLDAFDGFDTTTVGERTATIKYVSAKGSFAKGFDYSVTEKEDLAEEV